jgi:hypothetical protein
MRGPQAQHLYVHVELLSCSEHPQVPDFSDRRRALEDEVCDVLGQQRAGNIGRDTFHELRRHLNDEHVGLAFQAVFVTGLVIHVSIAMLMGAEMVGGAVRHILFPCRVTRPENARYVEQILFCAFPAHRCRSQYWRGRQRFWVSRRRRLLEA